MKQAATSRYKQLLVFVLVSACICLYVFLENQIQAETSRYKQIQAGGKRCYYLLHKIQADTSRNKHQNFRDLLSHEIQAVSSRYKHSRHARLTEAGMWGRAGNLGVKNRKSRPSIFAANSKPKPAAWALVRVKPFPRAAKPRIRTPSAVTNSKLLLFYVRGKFETEASCARGASGKQVFPLFLSAQT